MFDQIVNYISDYGSPILLGLLLLFVGLGMLFGIGRGLKRSAIRLITVVTFIGAAFLLTPALTAAFTNLNVIIAGKTPSGWLDTFVSFLGNSDFISSIRTTIPDIDSYVYGIALAAVNILLFVVLYFIAKGISWIIYAIVANNAAPVKNKKTGEKEPKHAFFGMIIGAIQGLVLFFFLMIPINGLINVTANVASYQPLGGLQLDQGVTISTSAVESQTPSGMGELPDITASLKQIDGSITVYKNVMKYTGIEFLTNKAFDYQTTIKLQNSKVILSHDLSKLLQIGTDGIELAKTFEKVTQKINITGDPLLGIAELTHNDYQALKYFATKVLSLDTLKLGNTVLKDLDKVLSMGMKDGSTVMAGTESWAGNKIYEDSAYAYLIKKYASVDEPEKFITGVRAVVNYVANSGIGLVKDDLVNALSTMEDLFTIKIKVLNEAESKPIILAFLQTVDPVNFIDIFSAKISEGVPTALANKYPADYTVLDVLFSNLTNFQIFKILEQNNADYIVTYSNFFENSGVDKYVPELSKYLKKFVASFLGEGAVGTDANPGAWLKVRNALKDVLPVVKNYWNISQDFEAIVRQLITESGGTMNYDEAVLQAVMKYVSGLIGTEEITKYAKVDEIAEALHTITGTFPAIAEFLLAQVNQLKVPESMQSFGNFKNILVNLLSNAETSSAAEWKSLFQSLADVTDMLSNNPVIQEILSIDFTSPDAVAQVFEKVVGTAEDPGLEPRAVAEIVDKLLDIPNVNEIVTEILVSFDFGFEGINLQITDLQNKSVEELTIVIEELWAQLRDAMQNQSIGRAA